MPDHLPARDQAQPGVGGRHRQLDHVAGLDRLQIGERHGNGLDLESDRQIQLAQRSRLDTQAGRFLFIVDHLDFSFDKQ